MPAMGVRCSSLQRPQKRMINGYLKDSVKKRRWVFWGLQQLGAATEVPEGFVPLATPCVAHGDALQRHCLRRGTAPCTAGAEQDWTGLGSVCSAWGELSVPGKPLGSNACFETCP